MLRRIKLRQVKSAATTGRQDAGFDDSDGTLDTVTGMSSGVDVAAVGAPGPPAAQPRRSRCGFEWTAAQPGVLLAVS